MKKLLGLVSVGLVSAACAVARPSYNIVIMNSTPVGVSGAHVRFGEFTSIGGHLSPGVRKIHLEVDRSFPEKATVEWRTQDGVLHRQVVVVRESVPPGFAGDLIFAIQDSGDVAFRAETWAEQDARREREHPPIFAPGELEIDSATVSSNPFTRGLAKWSHPELEASVAFDEPLEVLVELASRIKRDEARYTPGQRIDLEGHAACFSDGDEGRLLVAPCP